MLSTGIKELSGTFLMKREIMFKNRQSKICGRCPLKIWNNNAYLNQPYQFSIFKGCLPLISLVYYWLLCFKDHYKNLTIFRDFLVITPWTESITLEHRRRPENVQDIQSCMSYVRPIYVLYPGGNLSYTQINDFIELRSVTGSP